MVEANSCAQIEVAEVCIVLHKKCLLAIVGGLVEEKIEWRGRIEDRLAVNLSSSNVIRKLLVHQTVNSIGSRFDLVVMSARGHIGAQIALAEAAILKGLNGS